MSLGDLLMLQLVIVMEPTAQLTQLAVQNLVQLRTTLAMYQGVCLITISQRARI